MTDTVEDHVDAARKIRELVERLARCTDPRTALSIDDELEAFAWFIAEAKAILDAPFRDAPELNPPPGITDAMVEEAMTRAKTTKRRSIVWFLHESAATADTPSDCVDMAVARFKGAREAWVAQGRLKGEAWKKANPNWRG